MKKIIILVGVVLIILSIVMVIYSKSSFNGIVIGNNPKNGDDYLWTSGVSENMAKELYPESTMGIFRPYGRPYRDRAAEIACRSAGYLGFKCDSSGNCGFNENKNTNDAPDGDNKQYNYKCNDKLVEIVDGYPWTDYISNNRAKMLGYSWRDGMADAVCRDAGYDGVASVNYFAFGNTNNIPGDDVMVKFKCGSKKYTKLPKSEQIVSGFDDNLIKANSMVNGITGNWTKCISDKDANAVCVNGGFNGVNYETGKGPQWCGPDTFMFNCTGDPSQQDFTQQFTTSQVCGNTSCSSDQVCTLDNTCVNTCEEDPTRPGYITMPTDKSTCVFNDNLFKSRISPTISGRGTCTSSEISRNTLKKDYEQNAANFTDPTYVSWVDQAAINCKNTANCKTVSVWLDGGARYFGDCNSVNNETGVKTYDVSSLNMDGLLISSSISNKTSGQYFSEITTTLFKTTLNNIKCGDGYTQFKSAGSELLSLYQENSNLIFYVCRQRGIAYNSIYYTDKPITKLNYSIPPSISFNVINTTNVTPQSVSMVFNKLTIVGSDGNVYQNSKSNFKETPDWVKSFYDSGQQKNSPNPIITKIIQLKPSGKVVALGKPNSSSTNNNIYIWLEPNGDNNNNYSTRSDQGKWVGIQSIFSSFNIGNIKDITQLYNNIIVVLTEDNKIYKFNNITSNLAITELNVTSAMFNKGIILYDGSKNISLNCITKDLSRKYIATRALDDRFFYANITDDYNGGNLNWVLVNIPQYFNNIKDFSINSDGSVVVVDGNGAPWYSGYITNSKWVRISGGGEKISSTSTNLVLLNKEGLAYYYSRTGDTITDLGQIPFPSGKIGFNNISLNPDGSLFASCNDYTLWYRTPGGTWADQLWGGGNYVSSTNKLLIMLGGDDIMYYYTVNNDTVSGSSPQIPHPNQAGGGRWRSVSNVSGGDNSVVATDNNGAFWYTSDITSPDWKNYNGTGKKLIVSNYF